MLGLVPFVCLIFLVLCAHCALRRMALADDWRLSVLSGAILWGGLVVAETELLSLFAAITFPAVLSAWLVLIFVTAALAAR